MGKVKNSDNMAENAGRSELEQAAADVAGGASGGELRNSLALAEEAEWQTQAERRKNVDFKDNSPLIVDDTLYKRFDSHMTAFNVTSRKLGRPWPQLATEIGLKIIFEGKTARNIKVDNVAESRALRALQAGTDALNWETAAYGHGKENTGILSWNPVHVPAPLRRENRPPDETDPNTLTTKVKTMARLAGADLVGIGPMNERWLYTRIQRNYNAPEAPFIFKNIKIGDVDAPTETEEDLIIPRSVNRSIVMAVSLNHVFMQSSPATAANAMAELGYSRMAMLVLSLAEFIRAMGYIAIPSMNGIGPSVPMAVEAGLGEAGRHGLLMTPEFGTAQRLCKVYTNMPLNLDKPIDFGGVQFCKTCKKCANSCPAGCLPLEDEPQWEPRVESNNGGVYKWYNNTMKCLQFWISNGNTCSTCLASCTFTKGPAWTHDLTRLFVKHARFVNPIWVHMDDAFGFGERRDARSVWNMPVGTYGLEPGLSKPKKY